MPIISKEAAQRHLDMWMEAEAAVSTGQSYQIEQMMLTRASLKQIRESIIFWEKKVAEAEAEEKGRGRNRIQEIENATLPGAEDEANEAKFVKPIDSASAT